MSSWSAPWKRPAWTPRDRVVLTAHTGAPLAHSRLLPRTDPGQLRAPPLELSSGRSCSEAGPAREPAGTSCRSRGAGLGPQQLQRGGPRTRPPPPPGHLQAQADGRSLGPIPPRGPELEAAAKGQSLGHRFFPEPEIRPYGGAGPSRHLPLRKGRPSGQRMSGRTGVRPTPPLDPKTLGLGRGRSLVPVPPLSTSPAGKPEAQG